MVGVLEVTSEVKLEAAVGMPNKPMVPIATIQLAEHPPTSPRRHIGEPLGSLEERGAETGNSCRRTRRNKFGGFAEGRLSPHGR